MEKIKQAVVHPKRNKNFVTGAYSDGVVAGDFLFVSGQASVDFETSAFIRGSIEEETRRTLENIRTIIESAGGSMNDVVKCTAHLTSIDDFEQYNIVYKEFFSGVTPARTTVQSVLAEDLKVEIDCITYIKKP